MLDLAGRDPVRRRFRFSDDDLYRLEEWVNGAFVRWGFDAAHRSSFQLEGIAANTWQAGLDRILLGVTMAEERQRLFGDTLPLDDVDSGDIDLAGRLAEFLERLQGRLDALAGFRPVAEWAATLAELSDSLVATTPGDAWQRAQLKAVLDELVGEATEDEVASAVDLSCDDVRSILSERLRGRPTRANFRTGHLTVCTLVPMRSIPHRVVCLLGLDDGSFPRHIERDGDDLTARHPRVGDRDARSEDRQLLLDALLAAQDHLVVTYSGRDERTNLRRPPAVPVGELLDVVERTVRTPTGPCPRGHRARASAAAVRQTQLRTRRARAERAMEFRRAPPGRCPRRPGAPSRTRPPSWSARWTQPSPAPSGSISSNASCGTPCGRSCVSGSTSGLGTGPATSRTPSPSISAGWSDGRSPSACCKSAWAVPASMPAWTRSGREARCRRASWPSPS